MEGKRFQRRLIVITCLTALLLCAFLWVLYGLQVVNGDYYRGASVRKILNRETVEASRGEIRDMYGRLLVYNSPTYQVTLDSSMMGNEAQRNANLMELIRICQDQGKTWNDTFPVSSAPPFTFTVQEPYTTVSKDAEGNEQTRSTYLSRLLLALPLQRQGFLENGESEPTAERLVAALRGYYEVDESLSDREARLLVGVLYELDVRRRDINYNEYVFTQDVDIDFISIVKERGLDGVRVQAVNVREYGTNCAPHLLGRVGSIWENEWAYYRDLGYNMNDTVGKDGVEQAFESWLRGKPGVRALELTTTGKVVSETWETEPEPGGNVILTLDSKLQAKVEEILARTIESLESEDKEGGAIVVEDVRDGGILSMASYPDYDLTTIYSDAAIFDEANQNPLKPFLNRATMGIYSPGSTIKPLIAIAALEEGVVTPSERILDTGFFTLPEEERYPYGQYRPQCWIYRQYRGNHGEENLADALRDSCNIYFFTMGHRLGIEQVDRYASLFGLGQYTGFELPESSRTMVAGPETSQRLGNTWYGGLLLTASIGQGDTLCTPLQITNYIATLVNGGNHYTPHLLRAVKSNDYSETLFTYEPTPINDLGLDPDNLEAVKYGMWKVANDPKSTVYRYFQDLPVTVGAKTGTAQVASDLEADAVFVCFAPYENPEIAITLVVEGGGSGGYLAEAAAEIINYYFSAESTPEAINGENTLLH